MVQGQQEVRKKQDLDSILGSTESLTQNGLDLNAKKKKSKEQNKTKKSFLKTFTRKYRGEKHPEMRIQWRVLVYSTQRSIQNTVSQTWQHTLVT